MKNNQYFMIISDDFFSGNDHISLTVPGTFESMIIFLFNQGGIYVSSLEGI